MVNLLFPFALVAETIEKCRFLKAPYHDYPPEALGVIVNRSLFWWVSSLLFKGSSNVLKLGNLFDLDQDLRSERLHVRFRRARFVLRNACRTPSSGPQLAVPGNSYHSHRLQVLLTFTDQSGGVVNLFIIGVGSLRCAWQPQDQAKAAGDPT